MSQDDEKNEREHESIQPPAPQLRTREDVWREHVSEQMISALVEIDDLNQELGELKQKAVQAKDDVEEKKDEISGCYAKIRHYTAQMRDIKEGRFTPPLFDKVTVQILAMPAESKSDDGSAPGDSHSLSILTDYGITTSMVETLLDSQLASEVKLTTIGHLKKIMAVDPLWHRKVKGFGEVKINLLTDALIKHQQAFSEQDTRPKRCTFQKCEGAIFVDGKCPKCGNPLYFERVDSDEKPGNPEAESGQDEPGDESEE